MNLVNGKIDLNHEILLAKINNEKVLITRADETSHSALWIKNLHGVNYLLKNVEENEIYRSLLIQEMANIENIPFPKTVLAVYHSNNEIYDGELIEDYRQNGFDYINGTTILREYYLFLESSNRLQEIIKNYPLYKNNEDIILRKLNNLESIWNALEFHFRKYPNKNSIIAKIMAQLADRFAFDFLTMQRDRFDGNWEIAESYDLKKAELAPLFDCNKSFQVSSFSLKMDPGEDLKPSYLYEKLSYYLSVSDESFRQYFDQLLNKYPPSKIKELIANIEHKYQFTMETYPKIEIIGSYEIHYKEMLKIKAECKRGTSL